MGAPTTRRRAFYSGTAYNKPSILMCTVTFGCREMHDKPPRTVLHRCVHKPYSSRTRQQDQQVPLRKNNKNYRTKNNTPPSLLACDRVCLDQMQVGTTARTKMLPSR